jgi:hypothetical protein
MSILDISYIESQVQGFTRFIRKAQSTTLDESLDQKLVRLKSIANEIALDLLGERPQSYYEARTRNNYSFYEEIEDIIRARNIVGDEIWQVKGMVMQSLRNQTIQLPRVDKYTPVYERYSEF